jgi:hypothetical protein
MVANNSTVARLKDAGQVMSNVAWLLSGTYRLASDQCKSYDTLQPLADAILEDVIKLATIESIQGMHQLSTPSLFINALKAAPKPFTSADDKFLATLLEFGWSATSSVATSLIKFCAATPATYAVNTLREVFGASTEICRAGLESLRDDGRMLQRVSEIKHDFHYWCGEGVEAKQALLAALETSARRAEIEYNRDSNHGCDDAGACGDDRHVYH